MLDILNNIAGESSARPPEDLAMSREHRLNLLKMVPGLLISAFFLWWTFRGFDMADLESVRFVAPAGSWAWWCLRSPVTPCAASRAWWMLRSVKARFSDCARIFMTSLAANNILPLRIGDVMRVFTYAPDVNATPSMVLSTVILEKLLDVFSLAALFVITMHGGRASFAEAARRRGDRAGDLGCAVCWCWCSERTRCNNRCATWRRRAATGS